MTPPRSPSPAPLAAGKAAAPAVALVAGQRSGYRPPQVALPAYDFAEHLPPPADLFPTLRIVADPAIAGRFRAYFTRAITERLGLTKDQPIDVLPPSGHHEYWHLDTRPVAKHRLHWYMHTRPRIQRLDLPATILKGLPDVTLQLVPGEPAIPGFYPLLPDAYFARQPAPTVATQAS